MTYGDGEDISEVVPRQPLVCVRKNNVAHKTITALTQSGAVHNDVEEAAQWMKPALSE